jgi:hypothetical protein
MHPAISEKTEREKYLRAMVDTNDADIMTSEIVANWC